ncbi:MAG: LPS-assembly protein LptD [Thermaurantiacus sp.]
MPHRSLPPLLLLTAASGVLAAEPAPVAAVVGSAECPAFENGEPRPPARDEVVFSADELIYDEPADRVTAMGNVLACRDGAEVTADRITYDRPAGTVIAEGAVRVIDAEGRVAVADRVELSDNLRDGFIENALLVIGDEGRIAAAAARRTGGRTVLDRAVYSPCNVVDADGCPQQPLWAIKAARVIHDAERGRVRYRQARFEFAGVPIVALPRLSHPDSYDRNQSGILAPDLRVSRELGLELSVPYFIALAANRDLTVTPTIFTEANPVLGVEYRHLFRGGPVRLDVRGTYGKGQRFGPDGEIITTTDDRVQLFIESNGLLQHGDGWRTRFSVRATTEDSFPGRYQITLDDRLRSTVAIERLTDTQFFSVSGWVFQGLRPENVAARTPVALPLVEFLWRPELDLAGGHLLVEANSLTLSRRDGQSYVRALAQARWDRSLLTPLGQRVTFTGLLRGDIYNVRDSARADDPFYAGVDGWQARVIPLVAVDVEWPFAGPLGRGYQTITPRIQFVASTATANRSIPNEDSRAVDLEDTNLFSLNRFPGYDRWEGGARLVYGGEWRWARDGLAASAQIGQSYRLDDQPELFPPGTGLSGRFSDFVGRFSLQWRGLVDVTQRVRLDKDSLAIRRNEVDVTIGNRATFVTAGYLRFNRDIALEDLVDHEEIRVGARVAFARYWAIFGSAVADLTSRAEDPFTTNDGFQPIRHRLGLYYADECFEFGVTWRKDYVDNPNVRRGDTILFTLNLRNLG